MTFSHLNDKTILVAVSFPNKDRADVADKVILYFTDGTNLTLTPTVVHESSPPEFGAQAAIESELSTTAAEPAITRVSREVLNSLPRST